MSSHVPPGPKDAIVPALPRPLDPRTLGSMYAHATREFPRECCGYLRLDPEGGWQVHACHNQQDRLHKLDPQRYPRSSESAYHIGGRELLDMVRSFESDRPALVIYHSHPRVGAYFSQTDIQGALAAGYPVHYLVIDVQAHGVQESRLFTQRHGEDASGQAPFSETARYDAAGDPVEKQ